VTSFLGPLLLAVVWDFTDSLRLGMATILAFFVVGAVILMTVDVRRAIRA
jgi:MFS transporter, UMF1 family